MPGCGQGILTLCTAGVYRIGINPVRRRTGSSAVAMRESLLQIDVNWMLETTTLGKGQACWQISMQCYEAQCSHCKGLKL